MHLYWGEGCSLMLLFAYWLYIAFPQPNVTRKQNISTGRKDSGDRRRKRQRTNISGDNFCRKTVADSEGAADSVILAVK